MGTENTGPEISPVDYGKRCFMGCSRKFKKENIYANGVKVLASNEYP
jgi:hypothetical protein